MSDTARADISTFEALQNAANAQMKKPQSRMSVFNDCGRAFLNGMMSVCTFGGISLDEDTDEMPIKQPNLSRSDADALASDWQNINSALRKAMNYDR